MTFIQLIVTGLTALEISEISLKLTYPVLWKNLRDLNITVCCQNKVFFILQNLIEVTIWLACRCFFHKPDVTRIKTPLLFWFRVNVIESLKKILDSINFLKIMEVCFKHLVAVIVVIACGTGHPGTGTHKNRIRLTNQILYCTNHLCFHSIPPAAIVLVSANTLAISSWIASPFCFNSSGTIASFGLIVM